MAIIVNGTNIPTNGNYIKVGNTDITKVNVLKNGITTTVWERILFTTKEFEYTGGMQSVNVPAGLYKLEVWGAQGGCNEFSGGGRDFNEEWRYLEFFGPGGKGGYSCRYYYFSSETTLYVCVGGMGNKMPKTDLDGMGLPIPAGGYNGGRTYLEEKYYTLWGGTGGGCTHIATRTGELSTLESYKNDVLIVAGGGGGGGVSAMYNLGGHVYGEVYGGDGGGLEGCIGHSSCEDNGHNYGKLYGGAGTQTSGGHTQVQTTENYPDAENYSGGFGYGGYYNFSCFCGGTGGGGWYGGGCGINYNGASPGGGGSGYIGVSSLVHNNITYSNTSIAGQQSGNGKAKITFISS